jgi:hypothetical protein
MAGSVLQVQVQKFSKLVMFALWVQMNFTVEGDKIFLIVSNLETVEHPQMFR